MNTAKVTLTATILAAALVFGFANAALAKEGDVVVLECKENSGAFEVKAFSTTMGLPATVDVKKDCADVVKALLFLGFPVPSDPVGTGDEITYTFIK